MNFIKKVVFGNKITELIKNGNAHLAEDNYFSAITAYSQVLEINHEDSDVLFLRAKAYINANNFDKAQKDLEPLVKNNPSYNDEMYYLLSKSFLNQKKYDKASEYAAKYYSINNEDVQAQYYTARSKYFNKEYEEALKITDLLLAHNHEDFEPRYLRSMILFAENNFSSALREIDCAIKINALYGYSFNLRGLINIQLLNYQEAIDDFEYSIRLEPTNAQYHFNKAKIQLKIGALLEAKESILNSIEINPEYKSSYILKADIDLLTEDKVSALNSYNDALEFDPSDEKIINRIIDLKLELSDYVGASICLKKLYNLNKDDIQVLYKIASVEFKLGNLETVQEKLKEAVEKDPKNKDVILQKGVLEYWNNNYEEAILLFNSLILIDSSFDKAIYYKVRALIKLGKFENAEDELLNIEEEGRGKEYSLLSSQIKLSQKNIHDAEILIAEYKQIDPNNNSIDIVRNTLNLEQGKFGEIEELNEFQYEGELKESAQIINGLTSFEKGQFNSAKYRLSNLNELSKEKMALLKPFLEYAEDQIS